jgi:hypothetical protein
MQIATVERRSPGLSEAERIRRLAESLGAYRIYKTCSDADGEYTDYYEVTSPDQEAGILGSPFIHRPVLVYDHGQTMNC